METILESKSFENYIDIIFSEDSECSWGNISIIIYGSEQGKYLLSVYIENEGQCNKEGFSFYKFYNYDEMIDFIKNDEDIKINTDNIIKKINNNFF